MGSVANGTNEGSPAGPQPTPRASPERERAERLNLMVQSITDYAIFSLDIAGVITSWNPAAEQVFGYAGAEIIGQSFAVLFTPEDLEAGAPEAELGRAAKTGTSDDIRWHVRKDGRRIFVNGKVTSIRDEGLLLGFTKIAHDVTERKLLEERLTESNRRKDEFLAMLGHELRNPLNAINAAVQLIGRSSTEEVGWASDAVKRQVKHLSHLLDDLLDAARVTQGKIQLRREVFDATAAITRATETVRSVVEGHRHELNVTFEPCSMWVDADPTRLEQIVVNLLTNAAKYTPEGGRICLTAGCEGREVVIRVKDTGIGIPSEVLPHVFDLFRQAERSLDRSEGGLGIGFSLVKALAEMHGGSVTVASEGRGRAVSSRLDCPCRTGVLSTATPRPRARPRHASNA
jgi:PAS domain S-box-containing protein